MFKQLPRMLAGFVLALALVCAQQAFASGAAAAAQGQPVSFSLRTVDGGAITSEMLRGDVVVLAFGASWLPLSGDQAQAVQRLADEYADRNVRAYWVSTESEAPKSKNYASDGQLRDFARRNKLKIPVLRDPDGELFKRLGVERNQLPAIVILDKQGHISVPPIGGFNPDPNQPLVTLLAPVLNKLL